MSYSDSGSLTTDSREIASSDEWSSQSDWEANQISSGVAIENGTVRLEDIGEIPDSEDLHALYDATNISASDGESISTWGDVTGNGFDLTTGTSPTYRSSIINGNPVVRHDGAGDYLTVSFNSISTPYHIFAVGTLHNGSTNGQQSLWGGGTSDGRFLSEQSNDEWSMYNGQYLNGNTTDTQQHIFSTLYDGSNSSIRVDGTNIATGDPGSEPLRGFTTGTVGGGGGNYGETDLGEILIYPMDKSSIQSDVENYLSGKWGISV